MTPKELEPIILISMNIAPVGGVGADVLKCIRALCQQKRKVHVIYAFMPDDIANHIPADQVHWHRILMPKRPPVIAQIFIWLTSLRIIRKIKKTSPRSKVICFERLPIGNYVVGAAPSSLWEHARKLMGLSPFSKLPFKYWLKGIDKYFRNYYSGSLVMYSQRDLNRFIQEGGSPERVSRVIIPTDTHRFTPDLNHKDRKYITIIGLNAQHKGIDLALKAWKEIESKYPNIKLRVVTHAASVKKLVAKSLCHNIEVVGFIPQVEIYYHSSKLVLMPSMYETWGNVLPEALACGVPVIASTAVPSCEIITEPSYGEVISRDNPHDASLLIAAIEKSLKLDMSNNSMLKRNKHIKHFMSSNSDLISWILKE